jgi:hypothetical protein
MNYRTIFTAVLPRQKEKKGTNSNKKFRKSFKFVLQVLGGNRYGTVDGRIRYRTVST